MDWDLKTPSWDFPNLERGGEHNIGSVVGLNSLGVQKKKGDCSVDLKLGRMGDFSEGSSQKWKESKVSSVVSPPSASKRTRAINNGTNIVTCSVDGCNADLTGCKDYHKRHKVCEIHAKTPIVLVGGQEQRFCQQCSRFHLVGEFDEVKRSCRKRLDGHNRRRRKPQPESLSMNTGSLFSNRQGTRLPSCVTQQMLTSVMSDPSWSGLIKTEEDALYGCQHQPLFSDKQQGFTVSYPRSYKGGKQFPFLQGNDSTIGNQSSSSEASGFQPLLPTIPSSSESSGRIFDDGLTRVIDPECALSLLSSPTSTPSIGVSPMVQQTDRIPMAQPLVMGLQYNSGSQYSSQVSNSVPSTGFSCSGVAVEQLGTLLVSSATDAGFHCQDLLHVPDGGSLESGASQALPFSW